MGCSSDSAPFSFPTKRQSGSALFPRILTGAKSVFPKDSLSSNRGSDVEDQILYVMGDMEKDIRTHHIHIVKWNGTEWKNYIHFRDYLNDNENMALQYQKVKEELESKYADDRVAYTNGKQDMIDLILDNQ